MRETTKTRTQRRMERRQAVVLLVLLLVASLVCFVVGIFVGRHSAERNYAEKLEKAQQVLVAQAQPAEQSLPVPAKPLSAEPAMPVAVEDAAAQAPDLTYDDLSKEPEVPAEPLGSGINLAPEPVKESQPPIALPEQPIVAKQEPKPAADPVAQKMAAPEPLKSAEMPRFSPSGSHAVQVGSFAASKDAIALKEKLQSSGYPAYMVEADLGAKGLWYRVKVGPYAGGDLAKVAQQYLEQKDKIKGFVTRK